MQEQDCAQGTNPGHCGKPTERTRAGQALRLPQVPPPGCSRLSLRLRPEPPAQGCVGAPQPLRGAARTLAGYQGSGPAEGGTLALSLQACSAGRGPLGLRVVALETAGTAGPLRPPSSSVQGLHKDLLLQGLRPPLSL